MSSSTWRSTVVGGLMTLVNAYKSANPTLLLDVRRKRPKAIGETPMVYFGGRSERINQTGSILQRSITVPIVILDTLGDNEENADRVDDLVDALVKVIVDNPHGGAANTLISVIAVADLEDEFGPVIYSGSALTVLCEEQTGAD